MSLLPADQTRSYSPSMVLVAADMADEAGSCYITNVGLICEFTCKGIARTLLDQVAEPNQLVVFQREPGA